MGALYKGINDLKTYCASIDDFQLLIEWTGHCLDDNRHYNSDEVTKALNKRFWIDTIYNRVYKKTKCPYCNNHKHKNIH